MFFPQKWVNHGIFLVLFTTQQHILYKLKLYKPKKRWCCTWDPNVWPHDGKRGWIHCAMTAVRHVFNLNQSPPMCIFFLKSNPLLCLSKKGLFWHLSLQGESEEYIPLREYLLRHDKAIFWVIESMIPWVHSVFNHLTKEELAGHVQMSKHQCDQIGHWLDFAQLFKAFGSN